MSTIRHWFGPIRKVGVEFTDDPEEEQLGGTELGTDDPTTVMDRVLLQCLDIQRCNYGITTWFQPKVAVAFLQLDCSADRQYSVRRIMAAHHLITAMCDSALITRVKATGDQMVCTCGLNDEKVGGVYDDQSNEGSSNGAEAEVQTAANRHPERALVQAVTEFMRVLTAERYVFSLGLGLGPVVAGVIGRNSLWYDALGPAVESARKMALAVPLSVGLRCTSFEECGGGGACFVSPDFEQDCPGCFSQYPDIQRFTVPSSSSSSEPGASAALPVTTTNNWSDVTNISSSGPMAVESAHNQQSQQRQEQNQGHIFVLDSLSAVVERVLNVRKSSSAVVI